MRVSRPVSLSGDPGRGGFAVPAASRGPPDRRDLDDHPTGTFRTEPRRVDESEPALAQLVVPVRGRLPTPGAVRHSVSFSALIGIFSSASIARSWLAGR